VRGSAVADLVKVRSAPLSPIRECHEICAVLATQNRAMPVEIRATDHS
jgi:hypothetical protein